jgi:ADP-ribose pyrophosphatase
MKDIKKVEVIKELTSSDGCKDDFVCIRKFLIRNIYEDGSVSREYRLYVVDRKYVDALGIVLYYYDGDRVRVILRKTLRPVIMFRTMKEKPFAEDVEYSLIEIVAGVVEFEDVGEEGLRRRAILETKEESGYEISYKDIVFLGEPIYSSPGLFPEKIYLLAGRVEPNKRSVATGDGSPMEEAGKIIDIPLEEAIDWCVSGKIKDSKTEIALRRLREFLGK